MLFIAVQLLCKGHWNIFSLERIHCQHRSGKVLSSLLTEEEWGNIHLAVILFVVASSIVIFMAVLAGCVCIPAKIYETSDDSDESVMKRIVMTVAIVSCVKMKTYTLTDSNSVFQ